MRPARLRIATRIALAALPIALLWPALRDAIESRMALHMLLEFPLLFAAGWAARSLLAGTAAARGMVRRLEFVDWCGWTGGCIAGAVAMFWMVPSALDAALLSPAIAALKMASWWAAGFLLGASWPRLEPEPRLFVGGNAAWATATAGLLYLDAPSRLCANYLRDDQREAGIGLVVAALLLATLSLWPMRRRTSTTPPRGAVR